MIDYLVDGWYALPTWGRVFLFLLVIVGVPAFLGGWLFDHTGVGALIGGAFGLGYVLGAFMGE